ncbi:iron-containing alcohol dehydrogenase family protein [Lactococcus allomyrinae]|uniref:Iron-containing alcohol dehydrogenase family protein n=1 Tax=Lactococcus allomyrinae TaxID=2419773 RepID=A0A387BG73_9LACT|nr:iron-containing alcohol dehydrogenase family protein [Lactococcus allomyrinae]AYF99996.1 iron-containing alcohol dehydrogenase family protein [Lactococcus allomyrinae]
MNLIEEVRPGANRYVSGVGVLKDLPEYLGDFEKVAIVTGEQSYQVFLDFYQGEFTFPVFRYDGTASTVNGSALADKIGKADVILAIGGGRVIDTAKVVARELGCDLVVVPTLISNCAPYTPVAALYHSNHTFDKVDYFARGAYLTLVDWEFLLATPREYLVAGIGDTVAKWYEMEGIVRHVAPEDLTASVRLGFASAKTIFKILFEDSAEALQALENQEVTSAFGRIADTIIELSGTVGGFAGSYGRMSGAHALHNGLSLLPETHTILHGSKVAYGVLVQLAYTGDLAEVEKLLPFYAASDLPTRLAELNITDFDRQKLLSVAEFAASSKESYVLIDSEVTDEKVLDAIEKLEQFVAKVV